MKKIIIVSNNPVKIDATLKGFQKMFPSERFEIDTCNAVSGVKDQPDTDKESFRGAMNRVENSCRVIKEADFWVGIEGGIEEKEGEMEVFAWVVIKSADGKFGKGKTSTFFLPKRVAELIKQGKELGEADDIVFGKINSKQNNGAVGILTNNVIDRTKYYTEAVILALIPFKNKDLY
ncbi:inositol monophosphatase [bacterium CG_4_10_14_0_2_um_filter_33_32]|nr:MAG: inositol monophosphatase [bacterium CG2_30_33_46]PIR67861.1 MAG: inositol monophosphatase [bacterium CG10_big_fil_rev_8_21_14_0_10_33_18]PIU76715.1 MAG: inositol monophosphatase [bacterium CG06_land_8_20_14_3_00_33_50]PIW81043.1 MAG: inositol monophosphatase [bacterium CG_4_8_14_3_um_filter_33_28]PIY84834.1 MAG: inositol monophosphatase [bacterium CG_4_10_14_0_8_um_filter_33_57]PIZ86154.1 MAG: inositol monophosphatase [bacterium CG_4_10_14_0_2_um_filter_33_32]PJA72316.1 MAG: inositol 